MVRSRAPEAKSHSPRRSKGATASGSITVMSGPAGRGVDAGITGTDGVWPSALVPVEEDDVMSLG